MVVAGFEVPAGDPDAVESALRPLHTVAADLKQQEQKVKAGFATALADWHGARGDSFRNASAGIQVQVTSAQSTVESSLTVIGAYAKALRHAQEEIKRLHTLANKRHDDAQTQVGSKDPDSPEAIREWQHAGSYISGLQQQAQDLRTGVKTLAVQTAGVLDAGTETAVPGGSTLTPDQVRTRVDQAYGVEGVVHAMANGGLTEAVGWAALDTPAKAVPVEDVKDDGEPDWTKIIREENDKAITAWAIGSAPPAGWALGQLARNYAAYKSAFSKLPTSYLDVVGPELDDGRIYQSVDDILGEVSRMADWTDANTDAARSSYNLWKATAAAGEGGLPKGVAGLGHVFSVLGAAGDVMTLIDPGVENKTEGNVLRGAAGANLAGLGAVEFGGAAAGALGLDAAVGWVPVAGQIVVIGTGLFLAGDWAYHNWDTVKGWGKDVSNFVTDSVPHAFNDATHAVSHTLDDAGHDLADVGSGTVHGVSHAASSVGHFLGIG